MRLSSIPSLAVLALPILLHSPGALSAEPSKDASVHCGVSLSEALAAAEKALADKNSDSQARAITCLITAVRNVEANAVARARADHADAQAFRLMQQQAMAVGQRRVEVGMRIASLLGPPG